MTDARRGKQQTLPRKGRGNFEAGDTLANPVLSVEAGEEVKIPCQLQGPKLTWYWIPQYPICVGFSHGGKQEIFSTSSVGEDQVLLGRFQSRAEKQGEKGERNLVLVLKSMNDSGTFYCSNGNRNSSKISVSGKCACVLWGECRLSLKPGERGGSVRTDPSRSPGFRKLCATLGRPAPRVAQSCLQSRDQRSSARPPGAGGEAPPRSRWPCRAACGPGTSAALRRHPERGAKSRPARDGGTELPALPGLVHFSPSPAPQARGTAGRQSVPSHCSPTWFFQPRTWGGK
uniref:Ig-like domain-containing protein n=1 Tax=Podarcis muralis TaxID=64176 RepID=A0A670HUA6_PODMU